MYDADYPSVHCVGSIAHLPRLQTCCILSKKVGERRFRLLEPFCQQSHANNGISQIVIEMHVANCTGIISSLTGIRQAITQRQLLQQPGRDYISSGV